MSKDNPYQGYHAQLLEKLERLECENAALRAALREIADASGFDNIGNWARNKAKDALAKEAQP